MNDLFEDRINGLSGHVAVIDLLMKFTARDLTLASVPLILALWFWQTNRSERALNQRIAVATTAAVFFSLGIAGVLGSLVSEARPFVSDSSSRLLISHSPDNSFPSEHAAFAFAVAGVLVWWRPWLGRVCLVLAALVAFSRIYVGVHWPADVLASAAIGLVTGAFTARLVPLLAGPQRLASRLLPRLLVESPDQATSAQ
jgi:undecaprenyl-diphosphatase